MAAILSDVWLLKLDSFHRGEDRSLSVGVILGGQRNYEVHGGEVQVLGLGYMKEKKNELEGYMVAH